MKDASPIRDSDAMPLDAVQMMPNADAAKMLQAFADLCEVLDRYRDDEGKIVAVTQVFGRVGVYLLQAAGAR